MLKGNIKSIIVTAIVTAILVGLPSAYLLKRLSDRYVSEVWESEMVLGHDALRARYLSAIVAGHIHDDNGKLWAAFDRMDVCFSISEGKNEDPSACLRTAVTEVNKNAESPAQAALYADVIRKSAGDITVFSPNSPANKALLREARWTF